MEVNLRSLIGKLNRTTRNTLESAAGLCLSRTHYEVEIEHFLTKLLDATGSDFALITRHFGVDKSRLAGELGRSLDKLKSGNARNPVIGTTVFKMFTEGWTYGSLEFGSTILRSGYAIVALTSNEELVRLMRDISREFQKIEPAALRKDFRRRSRNGGVAAPGRRRVGRRSACEAGKPHAISGSVHRRSHRQRKSRQDR
jgi:type VI secretion system protein VasG